MVPALVILLNVDVDGKMGIDVSHLVLVSLGDTDNQILDERLHGSQGSDILSRAVVNFDLNDLLVLSTLGNGEGDRDVRKILGEFAWRMRMLIEISCTLDGFQGLSDRAVSGISYLVDPRQSRCGSGCGL